MDLKDTGPVYGPRVLSGVNGSMRLLTVMRPCSRVITWDMMVRILSIPNL